MIANVYPHSQPEILHFFPPALFGIIPKYENTRNNNDRLRKHFCARLYDFRRSLFLPQCRVFVRSVSGSARLCCALGPISQCDLLDRRGRVPLAFPRNQGEAKIKSGKR
jgi:hypothetical protein